MQFIQSVLHNEKFTSNRSQDPNVSNDTAWGTVGKGLVQTLYSSAQQEPQKHPVQKWRMTMLDELKP